MSEGPLASVGNTTFALAETLAALGVLPVRAVARVLRRPREGGRAVWDETLRQIRFTGVEGAPVVAGLGFLVGAIITGQTLAFLNGPQGQQVLGTALRLVVVREVGPLLTAMVVIARSGSAITVDLGNLSLRGEVDLLESLGIDPVRYLVVPRLIGVTTSVLGLGVVFDLLALIGGFAMAHLLVGTPLDVVMQVANDGLDPSDIATGIAKCAVFGLIVATVSTYQGLSVRGSVLEVPRATRRSVVHALVGCIVLDAIATVWTYREAML